MTRPRIVTILTAALASSSAFYVITRSGLAGSLAGAAVASMVYTGTNHWVGAGLERCTQWWRGRSGLETAEPGALDPPGAAGDESKETAPGATGGTSAPSVIPASATGGAGPRPRRLVARWAPVVLAAAALATSAYSVVSGTPIERVVVQERVVEKPVVQERVVVQKETVTVTVPARASSAPAASASGTPADTTTTSSTTTTVDPTSTVTTGQPAGAGGDAGSTTTTSDPPSTTTTTVPPATTSTDPAPTPGG